MAISVTGGAGYIGSVMVELMRAKGEEVVVLDNLSRGHLASVDASVPFYQGAVGDRVLVARVCQGHRVEACIHFAALAYVGESVTEPKLYFENNVEQGIALLDALLGAGVRALSSLRPARPTASRSTSRLTSSIRNSRLTPTVGRSFFWKRSSRPMIALTG